MDRKKKKRFPNVLMGPSEMHWIPLLAAVKHPKKKKIVPRKKKIVSLGPHIFGC